MAFCKNCGAELKEEDKFCPSCGSEQAAENTTEPVFENVPPIADIPAKASGQLNVGFLIWSILNILFCCMPLAIVSLIMTVTAPNAATAEDEKKKLKTAKICNLIATIGSAVFFIGYIFLVVIGVLAQA